MTDHGTPPPVDFRLLIASFTHQAMSSLGKLPHPVTGAVEVDLPWARYFIDLLGMLEAKTAGNLDDGERAALEGNLATLRLNFVDVQKAEHGRPSGDATESISDDASSEANGDD